MLYRTKVEVRTNGRVFPPGSILRADVSAVDLGFLRKKGFVEPADVASVLTEEKYEELPDMDNGFDGFDELKPDSLKSPDEVRKIRSKKEAAAYAASIGLGLDEYEGMGLKELREAIINFQEEQLTGSMEME